MSKAVLTQEKASPEIKPVSLPVQNGLLQRKCACGGSPGLDRECAECREKRLSVQQRAEPVVLQTKLTVNQLGDRYEQEADQIAERVMCMPEPGSVAPTVTPALQTRIHSIRGGGQPLSPSTRAFMEPRFGHDFSQVRLHTDSRAAETARAVNARVYTVGRDIVFGTGQYEPETSVGKQLLVHELTHVIQQSFNGPAIQRAPAISKCNEATKEAILEGVPETKRLTRVALEALGREFSLSYERKAIKDNFGDISEGQKKIIISRYENIRDSVDSKEFICKPKCKASKGSDFCGEGEISGKTIYICPLFGDTSRCGSAGVVILHEAAHNAGASADIEFWSKSYPPKNAQNNAYSYEHFPVDIDKGSKGIPEAPLPPKREPDIRIPGE